MSLVATMDNPAAAHYQGDLERSARRQQTRDEVEAIYRRTMPMDMRNGTFLNDFTEDWEWLETLTHLFELSYTATADELACAVIGERERYIDTHAKRKALADSEG